MNGVKYLLAWLEDSLIFVRLFGTFWYFLFYYYCMMTYTGSLLIKEKLSSLIESKWQVLLTHFVHLRYCVRHTSAFR